MNQDGAFDEAVRGVDAILHTASPLYIVEGDPDEIIVPAVKGSVGILQSAQAHGSSVKRIVSISSTASVFTMGLSEPRKFNENDWNDRCVELVRAQGKDAPAWDKYRASKMLAEKAAWE